MCQPGKYGLSVGNKSMQIHIVVELLTSRKRWWNMKWKKILAPKQTVKLYLTCSQLWEIFFGCQLKKPVFPENHVMLVINYFDNQVTRTEKCKQISKRKQNAYVFFSCISLSLFLSHISGLDWEEISMLKSMLLKKIKPCFWLAGNTAVNQLEAMLELPCEITWLLTWILLVCVNLHTKLSTGNIFIIHHDDVIKWKHFPRYWPFVRGIHRFPVNSPHKTSDAELWCFLWSAPELSKQWWGWWFKTLYRVHHDVIVMSSSLFWIRLSTSAATATLFANNRKHQQEVAH